MVRTSVVYTVGRWISCTGVIVSTKLTFMLKYSEKILCQSLFLEYMLSELTIIFLLSNSLEVRTRYRAPARACAESYYAAQFPLALSNREHKNISGYREQILILHMNKSGGGIWCG